MEYEATKTLNPCKTDADEFICTEEQSCVITDYQTLIKLIIRVLYFVLVSLKFMKSSAESLHSNCVMHLFMDTL